MMQLRKKYSEFFKNFKQQMKNNHDMILITLTDTYDENKDIFACPSYPPTLMTNWTKTFGIWADPPENLLTGIFKEKLMISNINNPSGYPHIADTTSRGRMGIAAQQFYIFRTSKPKEVHARHNKKANIWFLDGHADSINKTNLEGLGIDPQIEIDDIAGYFDP